jgi:hypothetical protein
MLPHSVTSVRVSDPRQGTIESIGKASYVPTRINLAYASDEIGASADSVRDHWEDASGHCLVDDEAPVLRFARQDNDVSGMIVGWQFSLIDETCHYSLAANKRRPDFPGKHAIANKNRGDLARQESDRGGEIKRTLSRIHFPAVHDHSPVGRELPFAQQFGSARGGHLSKTFVIN